MTEQLWFTLLALAQLGAASNSVRTSTPRLARLLNISQQTTSRRLCLLERKGWINRTLINRGQVIRITSEGLTQLKQVYSILETVITKKSSVTLRGRVFTGLGEGAYYMRLEGYRKQFRDKLGFDPFPGTLNIQLLTNADVHEFQLLRATIGLKINGFVSRGRSFGSVTCYPATLNEKQNAAILIIQRTHHFPNVVEIISPVNLREQLHLSDDEIITIKAQISE
jgi:riboflavin kinase